MPVCGAVIEVVKIVNENRIDADLHILIILTRIGNGRDNANSSNLVCSHNEITTYVKYKSLNSDELN